MFLKHYNLAEQPFGVTPDTRFLYLNHMYREALASLWYGVTEGRGFMALIADPGMGKTTLLFQLLQRLQSRDARTVFIFQRCGDPTDLIRCVLLDLDVSPAGDLPTMTYQLNDELVRDAAAGRQFVLVIDEAHNLSEAVLENIRLLSDFETSQGKLLQIILAGQPQLVGTLIKPEMLQLTQRISATNFLDPLPAEEVSQYIRHRLEVAGYQGKDLFTMEALQVIAEESGGIPRNVNNICFGALTTAFALGRKRVDDKIIQEVASEQSSKSLEKRMRLSLPLATRSKVQLTQDAGDKPAVRAIRSRNVHLNSFNKYTRAGVASFALLALTTGVVIWARPELRASPSNKRGISITASGKAVFSQLTPVSMSPQHVQDTVTTRLGNDRHVIAEPQQTLRQICLLHLGRYDPKIVRNIQTLNPGLDPDRIEAGQRIQLPFTEQESAQKPAAQP